MRILNSVLREVQWTKEYCYCWSCAWKSSTAFHHHFCRIVSGRVIPPNRALTINDNFTFDCYLVKLWEFKSLQGTRAPSFRACRCNDFTIQLHDFYKHKHPFNISEKKIFLSFRKTKLFWKFLFSLVIVKMSSSFCLFMIKVDGACNHKLLFMIIKFVDFYNNYFIIYIKLSIMIYN